MNQKVLTLSLRRLSSDVSSIADALEALAATSPPGPEPTAQEEMPKEKVPTEQKPAKTYSFEEARGIISRVAHAGRREEVRALVLSHGGTSISSYEYKPDILAQLVKEVEDLADGE